MVSTTNSSTTALVSKRRLWFVEYFDLQPHIKVENLPESIRELHPIEIAAVVLTIGVGHNLGLEDAEIVSGEIIPASDTTSVLAKYWRTANVPYRFADEALLNLVSLKWAVLNLVESPRAGLVEELMRGQVAQRMSVFQPMLDRLTDDPTLVFEVLSRAEDYDRNAPYSQMLTGGGSHFELSDLMDFLTPVEMRYAINPSGSPGSEIGVAARRSVQHIYEVVENGWSHEHGIVPPWLADAITVRGARQWYASAGLSPGVAVTAESNDVDRLLRAWTYNPVFALNLEKNDRIGLTLVLDAESDNPLFADFIYPFEDFDSFVNLWILTLVGTLRVEALRLSGDGELTHSWTHGVILPDDLVLKIWERLAGYEGPLPSQWPRALTGGQVADLLATIDRHTFEHAVLIAPRELDVALQENLDRLHQLQHNAAIDTARNAPVDETLLAEAHELVRNSLSTYKDIRSKIDFSALEAGHGYVRFFVSTDAPYYLQAYAIFKGPDGDIDGRHYEFSSSIDLRRDWSGWGEATAHFVVGLSPMRDLMQKGITNLFVSSGQGIYGIPFHDPLMRMGFEQVSYLPGFNFYGEKFASQSIDGALVVGYAGKGANLISAVDVELLSVAESLGVSISPAPWDVWPRTVHIAGHGYAGSRPHEFFLKIGPADNEILSSARVLRDVDASGSDLVFLSACSTGTGNYAIADVMAGVPLDVAVIARGATSVISTAAPVNDLVALLFSELFYKNLAQKGATPRSSYFVTRRQFETRNVARTLAGSRFSGAGNLGLEDWASVARAADLNAPDDWRLFRLSGGGWSN